MAHLVKCHLGMHINYSLIKQCYDTVVWFKTVFSASKRLSTTHFSNMIDHHVARWAKQHAIFHVKRTWRILPCPVVHSDVYRKMWSCFRFRRSTRCFNNKLIHDHVCFRYYERNYNLQVTIELFLRRYLHCEWSKIVYSLPMSNHFPIRTSTRSRTCRTTHRVPVWLNARSQTIDDF